MKLYFTNTNPSVSVPTGYIYYTLEEFQKLYATAKTKAQKLCKAIPNIVDHGRHDAGTMTQDQQLAQRMEAKFAELRPVYDDLMTTTTLITSLYEADAFFCNDDGSDLPLEDAGGNDPFAELYDEMHDYLLDLINSDSRNLWLLATDVAEACCIDADHADGLKFKYPEFLYGEKSDTEELRKECLKDLVDACDQQCAKLTDFYSRALTILQAKA